MFKRVVYCELGVLSDSQHHSGQRVLTGSWASREALRAESWFAPAFYEKTPVSFRYCSDACWWN